MFGNLFLTLGIFLPITYAFVCPPDYCLRVHCVQRECNGVIRPAGGGFCGCCHLCVTTVGEGEECASDFILGVPRYESTECSTGLRCNYDTRLCEPQAAKRQTAETVSCAVRKAAIEARLDAARENGRPILGAWVPQCEEDGSYSPVQYMGSGTYCVVADGHHIEGYQGHIGSGVNCECARQQYEYQLTGMIGKFFRCTSNGDFAPIQCLGSVCFCADAHGHKLGDEGVNIGDINSLNC